MSFQVFDAVRRVDPSSRRHNEPRFHFLNRVTGAYWDQVRALLETWSDHYPSDARGDLVSRLRSSIDRQSSAAWWELYLHESLRRADFDVTVHPDLPGGRRPDFLAEGAGETFYLEAKSLFGKATGSAARLNEVLDALNKVRSPNFFLSLDIRAIGRLALPTKKLRRDLETWLNDLDPDIVKPHAWLEDLGERRSITQDGWDIHFHPLPISPEARGLEHQVVAAWNPHDGPAESATTIRASLDAKGSAYGELDHPLVLAFNLDSGFDRSFETANALYGAAMVSFSAANPDNAIETRNTDGYWGYPGAWRHRDVSAVLVGSNVAPWTAATATATLWHHPSPLVEVAGLGAWHRTQLVGELIESLEARQQIHELFGLADPWPSGEPFPGL
ncbi:hypothetical protein [Rathayibacter sp. AY1A7]|uniref:hypothetical protein n=1 Tax=Rathayibacter sp. AY1A7 TaxID=2080524 RepID=UPI0011B0CEC0|nr:hypothetical protein [Rathayibacter sp. AY1A7]